ncbi:MAG: Asp-tRNA(Asn)/Glu-tRNA(Gln) amidotransferase subunit GatC [Lachnospiraceae bacterium]|nr:Asp-tRNA(Asn)/Glu-tRNA(Gln) amidotransferase subunit GatC [Lachnospiraceae bacterium]
MEEKNKDRIGDEELDRLCSLAMLEAPEGEEREALRGELARMLDMLGELRNAEEDAAELPERNVLSREDLREDAATNTDRREEMLGNAPSVKDDAFSVPRTFA